MKSEWPKKPDREQFEITKFISAYARLPNGRPFVVQSSRESPDYLVMDTKTGEIFGIELTSVYMDDRSVPDEHMRPIDKWEQIHEDPAAMEKYKLRLIERIRTKVQEARKHYDTTYPLILGVYINEFISIYMEESDWRNLVRDNENTFDAMEPFREIILWNLINDSAMLIRPSPDRKTMNHT